jgi:hypothetical protein
MAAILLVLDLLPLAVAGAIPAAVLVAVLRSARPTLGLDCSPPLQVVDTETRVDYRLLVVAD